MRKSDESTQTVPEVMRLKELIDEIPGGGLRIPRFQRPYRWDPKDVLDLLDSINQAYPIGSLLLWETDHSVETLEHLGPLSFGPDDRRPRRLVLDGHQRLATLAGCLLLPSANLENGDPWLVHYDLLKGRFVHSQSSERPLFGFPLRALLRTVDFIRESRKLSELPGINDIEKLMDRAEQLAERFKNYKIAVVTIRGGDLGRAVDIFSRLNHKGKDISPADMISALTFVPSQLSLGECLDLLNEKTLERGFGTVRRGTLLQILLASLEIDPRISKAEELAAKLKREERMPEHGLELAETSLKKSLLFLSERVGVTHSKLLPYGPQLLMLCEYYRCCPGESESHSSLLERWFWHTSLSGWFAGLNDSQLIEALHRMRQFAMKPQADYSIIDCHRHARPLPEKFDIRSARIKAFLAFWFKFQRPLDPDHNPYVVAEVVNQGTLPYILRRSEFSADSYSDLSNRAFLLYENISTLFYFLTSNDAIDQDDKNFLSSHGFDDRVLASIKVFGLHEGLRARFHNFNQKEMQFMISLHIPYPEESTKDIIEWAMDDLEVDEIPF